MSWWAYVKRIAPGAQQAEVARSAGVTAPTVSRWSTGKQGVDPAAAASFARAYGRPVLEAFVAAGFLTAEEAKARPTAAPTLDSLTDDQLLDEVRERMSRHAQDETANSQAPGSGADELAERREMTPEEEQESIDRAVKRAARYGEKDKPGSDQSPGDETDETP